MYKFIKTFLSVLDKFLSFEINIFSRIMSVVFDSLGRVASKMGFDQNFLMILLWPIIIPIFTICFGLHWALICGSWPEFIRYKLKVPFIAPVIGLMVLQIVILGVATNASNYHTLILVGVYVVLVLGFSSFTFDKNDLTEGLGFISLTFTNMITIIVIMVIPALSHQNQTHFYKHRDAREYFESMPKSKGFKITGDPVEKNWRHKNGFQVIVEGDQKQFNTLILDYKQYVENELKKSGATVIGQDKGTDFSGFEFNYYQFSMTGIFKLNTGIDKNGNLIIDVFSLEHP